MAADTDKDGRITWNEMIEHIKKQPGYPQSAASGPGRQARTVVIAGRRRQAVGFAGGNRSDCHNGFQRGR